LHMSPTPPLLSPVPSLSILSLLFFFNLYAHPPHLPSFPTRRSSDLDARRHELSGRGPGHQHGVGRLALRGREPRRPLVSLARREDRKSTRLNSSHVAISYAVFCLKKKKVIAKTESSGHIHAEEPREQ